MPLIEGRFVESSNDLGSRKKYETLEIVLVFKQIFHFLQKCFNDGNSVIVVVFNLFNYSSFFIYISKTLGIWWLLCRKAVFMVVAMLQ